MIRVFVTGMGAVSAHGVGVAPLWDAAREGRSGSMPIEFERGIGAVQHAAVLRGFDPETHFAKEDYDRLDRFSQFAVVAAREALDEAGLDHAATAGPRTAVIVGTGIGGSTTFEEGCHDFFALSKRRTNPLTVPKVMANAAACQIGMRIGANGPSFAVSSACASANQAMGIAASLVRCGVVDRAITGGSETMVTSAVMRAWESMRVLTPDVNRPFSKGRNGMLIGEGAGIVVLESEASLAARGGTALAEFAGYGTTSDAADLLRPDAASAGRAMMLALEEAGLDAADIDYVSAHGTGTVLNDTTETEALRIVFGERAGSVPVSSTKPIHGHCLGASGALELIVTVRAMAEGRLPPTINWLEADPKCALDVIPNVGRPAEIRAAVSNSFAFGGINAVIALKRAGN